jgi:hypothetical protein
MFIETNDGSIEDKNGRVIYFSIDRFIRDIGEGDRCFICGANRSKTEFNDEHILPKWILKRYDLFSRIITLPNETSFRYDQYTVSCCQQCNSLMGEKIEQPVRELINQGFSAVAEHIQKNNGYWLFFIWLNLIFLKTHLKDKSLKLHRDSRQGNGMISDFYTWERLHHVHCIARSFYTGCKLDFNKVMGSFLLLTAKIEDYYEKFDYIDLHDSKAVLLRLDDICFITILNDSCFSLNCFQNYHELISGALSPIQLREILAHLAFINLNLKERPKFYSKTDLKREHYKISANVPEQIAIDNYEQSDFGVILDYCCKGYLDQDANPEIEFIKQQVKQGKYTFLVDEKNRFISDSMKLR